MTSNHAIGHRLGNAAYKMVAMRRSRASWIAGALIGMFIAVLLATVAASCGGGSAPAPTQAPQAEGRTAELPDTSPSESASDTTAVYQISEANQLTGEELVELRLLVLELVNRNRAEAGVAPVEMGSNPSAQYLADEMLEGDYYGFYMRDGRKPHMVYSDFGGTSYAYEIISASGWTQAEWEAEGCGSILDVFSGGECEVPDVREKTKEFSSSTALNQNPPEDVHLDKRHRKINIGIASNGRRMTFVLQFEGGGLEAVGRPTIDDGILKLSVRKNLPDLQLHHKVGIFWDPVPEPLDPAKINDLPSPCDHGGGGFTEECVAPIASILAPPAPGYEYANLDVNELIADVWLEDDDLLEVVADLGSLASDPGVYTVVVWEHAEGPLSGYVLLVLTVGR